MALKEDLIATRPHTVLTGNNTFLFLKSMSQMYLGRFIGMHKSGYTKLLVAKKRWIELRRKIQSVQFYSLYNRYKRGSILRFLVPST